MAEEEQDTSLEDRPEKTFGINLIYLKDASFEAPNSPGIFMADWQRPTIKIAMSNSDKKIEDGAYEVVQTITATATVGDTTAYLAEVQQAGIFIITGTSTDELHQMLNNHCLNILYPYAREAISSLVSKGTFPKIALAPINFLALYDQKLKKIRERESADEEPSD